MSVNDDSITHFMVSLVNIPPRGPAKLLVEVDFEARDIINYAASVAGISAQKFMRGVLVSAAMKYLDEAGKKYVEPSS